MPFIQARGFVNNKTTTGVLANAAAVRDACEIQYVSIGSQLGQLSMGMRQIDH